MNWALKTEEWREEGRGAGEQGGKGAVGNWSAGVSPALLMGEEATETPAIQSSPASLHPCTPAPPHDGAVGGVSGGTAKCAAGAGKRRLQPRSAETQAEMPTLQGTSALQNAVSLIGQVCFIHL